MALEFNKCVLDSQFSYASQLSANLPGYFSVVLEYKHQMHIYVQHHMSLAKLTEAYFNQTTSYAFEFLATFQGGAPCTK